VQARARLWHGLLLGVILSLLFVTLPPWCGGVLQQEMRAAVAAARPNPTAPWAACARLPALTRMHARMHTHTHTHTCVCLASQLSEAAEAHEANVATLKARVEYYQQAAVEAGREAEELRHRWGKV